MTAEIRQKIWNYAVKHDKAIYPKQVQQSSNKFWPYKKITTPNPTAKAKVQAEDTQLPEPLITAAQLALTCHQIYDEVAGTGLFYKLNEITFANLQDMLLYLVAITPIRRNALRSVIIEWHGSRTAIRHGMTMLATCEGLQRVQIKVTWPYYLRWGLRYWRTDGSFENLAELRGLESFTLSEKGPDEINLPHFPGDITGKERIAEVASMSEEIEAFVKQPRVVAVPVKRIRAAEEASKLNIFGDGRLGPDKKPGIIASRTRGQLQKQKTLNDLGIIQETEEHPKYSKFGDLLWDVKSIIDSRELASDSGAGRIEVNVIWADKHNQSWEILDRIVNTANVVRIARYYVKNPEAYDIGIAISTIREFVEKDDGKTFALDALTAMMKRHDNPEASAKARRLVRYRAFR
jgi:hypothetical protein